jgi:hypothetical protein
MDRKIRLKTIDGVEHHHCGKCKEYKLPEEFYKNIKSLTGRQSYCKICVKEYASGEDWVVWRKERYYRNPERTIWIEARSRANKSQMPFNIEPEDCKIPEFCPVLKIKLSPKGKGTHQDSTPTLDKVNPLKGYVKGNVNVISWKANRLKSNCDDPEVFEAIAAYIRNSKGSA